MFTCDIMVQVQLRMPKEMVRVIDVWVKNGKFNSRSDAIKTIVAYYEEKEKTRAFYEMLLKRSKQAKEKPTVLIPFINE